MREGVGRKIRTTSVKHGGPDPRVDAQVGPGEIEGFHWVRGMHAAAQPVQTEDMHEQIGDGEHDRRGLLHTGETPERPLAIILLHAHAALQRKVGEHVHACVLAVIRARPSREPQCEGLFMRRELLLLLLRVHRAGMTAAGAAVVVIRGCAGQPYALVEASLERIRAIPGRCVRDGTSCDHEEDGERKKVQAHALLLLCLILKFYSFFHLDVGVWIWIDKEA